MRACLHACAFVGVCMCVHVYVCVSVGVYVGVTVGVYVGVTVHVCCMCTCMCACMYVSWFNICPVVFGVQNFLNKVTSGDI